ncbi:MAG: PD-(D/E)XK nuclease-like domain-containing protein [Bacteroidia bacterium]|nr:PD-(D/E)XK nuclease-like domain-containing protein [Bacteroidia bacterium]
MEQSELFRTEIEQIFNKEKHLSFSALKAFLESPKHFYRYKTEKKTTEAMKEGSQFHMAVLEPVKFMEKYFVLDDSQKIAEIGGNNPRATNKYKEWKQEQLNQNSNKELISKEDYDLYLKMGEYLKENSATSNLMNGLIAKEKKFEFEYNGFIIDGKIDGEGEDYLLDLKKVADASFKKVKWVVYDMFYHMQGAIYSHAVCKNNYYLIFIDASINVTVVKISQETLQIGWIAFESALAEFQRCIEEDAFNSSYEFYNNGFIVI